MNVEYSENLAAFYEKFILIKETGAKFSQVLTGGMGGEYCVQFTFLNESGEHCLTYNCYNLDKTNAFIHANNISRIYRTCITHQGKMPKILPAFCNKCGSLLWTNRINKKDTEVCNSCHYQEVSEILSGDKTKNFISYVYLMKSAATGYLKIGTSHKPTQRAAMLQTGNGGKITIINLIRGGHNLEKRIHSMFSDCRTHGEWFEDDPKIIEFFDTYKE